MQILADYLKDYLNAIKDIIPSDKEHSKRKALENLFNDLKDNPSSDDTINIHKPSNDKNTTFSKIFYNKENEKLHFMFNFYNMLNKDNSHKNSSDDICTPMECVKTMEISGLMRRLRRI